MRRAVVTILSLLALTTMSLAAQKDPKVVKRPRLPATADTNDAAAYWRLGASKLAEDPYTAADAFYWSIQINPTWSDGYYGRWVAEWLEDPRELIIMMSGNEGSAGDAQAAQIDSLRLKALTLNPFLYERLKRTMMEQLTADQYPAGVAHGQVEVAMASMWNRTPMTRAVSAYSVGNFRVALAGYDTAITEIEWRTRQDPGKSKDLRTSIAAYRVSNLHLERGRIFYLAGNFDSASAELAKAASGQQASEEKRLVRVYESKAIIQQSIGLAFERRQMSDSAREAYGRALEEDLSYAPAHLSLGALALANGDTAQALSELAMAAQMSPNDAATAFFYGRALIFAGHDREAMEQLQRSIQLAPYFAAPHALLAFIYDGSDYRDEALIEFKTYLSLAVPTDLYVAKAKERVVGLSAKDPAKP